MPRSVVPSTAALAVCRFEEVSLPRHLLAQLEPRVQGLLSGRERGREVFAGALESGSPDQERRQVRVQAFPGRELLGEVAEAARDLAERFLELDLPRAEPGEKRFKQGPGGSRTTAPRSRTGES